MLPIRRVVLFKHGVGYFERQAEIEGDRSIELSFRASEMNDVLKSLTVLDEGGGHVASIGYESTLPLDKRLEDVALRLPESSALTGLLDQVKGARVRCRIASRTIEAKIAGIETTWRRSEDVNLQTHFLVLLADGGTLVSVDLLELESIEFLDESLRSDLGNLLDILISGKKKDLKKLVISARGSGKRRIVASYVIETPVWKTSYRILLGGERPFIQGWALVDNTQDEDWHGVSLTLVAGLPVSFVHDLYSPRYQRRPVVEVVREQAYAPPVMDAAAAEDEDYERVQTVSSRAAYAPPAAMPAAPAPRPRAAPARAALARASTPVETRVEQVGDLFEYAIERPVDVGRQQSALVPILAASFEGTKVAVYNAEVREKNPLSAILFENTTGLVLEGGPLTVLEDDRYLGESMLSTLRAGERRLVPFSVELGCTVTVDHKSDVRAVHRAIVRSGLLRLIKYQIKKTIYVARSVLETPLDLFIEHRFVPGWELIDTPKPFESTESAYRFRVTLPPKAKLELVVSERGDSQERYALSDVDREKVGFWLANRAINHETVEALSGVVELNERIAALDRQAAQCEREVQEISQTQERLRENLKALGAGQDERRLRERYIAELAQQEDRLRELFGMLAQIRDQRASADERLRTELASLALEVNL